MNSSDSNENLETENVFTSISEGPKEFLRESWQLINRCTKPDRKEFLKVSFAVAVGFFIMGFLGFVIKLIHIPINNIIMG